MWILVGTSALFLVGLGALAPISFEFAPYSLVIVMPAFLVAAVAGERFLVPGAWLGALIAAIAYFVVARYIARRGRAMPAFSVVIFGVIALLSLGLSAVGWEPTVRYVSLVRANALVAQAVLPSVAIAMAGYVMRRNMTIRRSLILHWVALAWFSWSAFPWYGELL